VRDGLSILDQAVAGKAGDEAITEDAVRTMLGLADRTQVFDLFEALIKGEIAKALDVLEASHEAGADAQSVMADLLELTHWLTRVKITPTVADDPVVPESERVIGRRLADGLAMPVLARAWQMLLKGLGEVQTAPQPMKAAEMVLVRLAYAADLPPPGDLVEKLSKSAAPAASAPAPAPASAPASAPVASSTAPRGGARPQPKPEPEPAPAEDAGTALPTSFLGVVDLLDKAREGRLVAELRANVHLVRYEPGRIEFHPSENADGTLASRLGAKLHELTGVRWTVTLSSQAGEATLKEQESSAKAQREAEAASHPLVKAALEAFPGARIIGVSDRAAADSEPPLPDPDDYGESEPDMPEEDR
jgi:DNA polymerase-3 subunit gamma/tau